MLAHVPDLNDFVGGMKILLKPGGVITMEFPHLMRLVEEHQFDTIYHEHFSYFSFLTVRRVFAAHGLQAVRRRGAADPRRLAAHLRRATTTTPTSPRPSARPSSPSASGSAGYEDLDTYRAYARERPGREAIDPLAS